MTDESADSSTREDIDIKPVVVSNGDEESLERPKKWSPSSLQDSSRRSAFQPYKQVFNTALTNLQRGNTQAETPLPQQNLTLHERAGQGELTEADVENINVNARDLNGMTLLHWASAYGQYNTVKLLLNKNADCNTLGPDEESPLILAASGGHHEVVALLINSGADVNHVDHLCNSALMYAAKGNHPHTCQELLLNNADFGLVNFNDDTAQTIAIDNNSTLAQTVIDNHIINKLEERINENLI